METRGKKLCEISKTALVLMDSRMERKARVPEV